MSIHNVVEKSNETTFRHEPIPNSFKVAVTITKMLFVIFVTCFAITILLIRKEQAVFMMRFNMVMLLLTAIAFLVSSLIANMTQHYLLIKKEDEIFCQCKQEIIIIKQPFKVSCKYKEQNWLQKVLKCSKKTIVTIYNEEQSVEFDGSDEDENGRRIYQFLNAFYRE